MKTKIMKTKITILSMMTASFFMLNSLKAQMTMGGNDMTMDNNQQITICHIPSGNPENCHQITISENAVDKHLEHGDKLFCYDIIRYPDYLRRVDNNSERIIIMFTEDGF